MHGACCVSARCNALRVKSWLNEQLSAQPRIARVKPSIIIAREMKPLPSRTSVIALLQIAFGPHGRASSTSFGTRCQLGWLVVVHRRRIRRRRSKPGARITRCALAINDQVLRRTSELGHDPPIAIGRK